MKFFNIGFVLWLVSISCDAKVQSESLNEQIISDLYSKPEAALNLKMVPLFIDVYSQSLNDYPEQNLAYKGGYLSKDSYNYLSSSNTIDLLPQLIRKRGKDVIISSLDNSQYEWETLLEKIRSDESSPLNTLDEKELKTYAVGASLLIQDREYGNELPPGSKSLCLFLILCGSSEEPFEKN